MNHTSLKTTKQETLLLLQEKIRLKFKLTYNTNEGPQSDVGEEDNFPVPL